MTFQPGRTHLREALHSVTDLSSDERSNVVASTKSSPRRRRSDVPTPPSLKTPRGATAILASQIDQEILELRSFYEQHRHEMLSLATTASVHPFVPVKPTSAQSVDTQTSAKSPMKMQRQVFNRQPAKCLESESDSIDISLQVLKLFKPHLHVRFHCPIFTYRFVLYTISPVQIAFYFP
jgi:hypothetical protein